MANSAFRARHRARARRLSLGDARRRRRPALCAAPARRGRLRRRDRLVRRKRNADDRQPMGALRPRRAELRLRRPHRRRAARRRVALALSPFSATLADGALWGRGAADMKGGVAAALAAALRFVARGAVQGLDLVSADRRRGRPRRQRHGQAPRLGARRAASASTIACSASRPARRRSATRSSTAGAAR